MDASDSATNTGVYLAACQTCGQPLARLLDAGEFTTLVGFWSPPGHNHNDNCLSRVYGCENGHRQVLSIRRRCHACEWVGKASCFCHQGQKVDAWPGEEPPSAPAVRRFPEEGN